MEEVVSADEMDDATFYKHYNARHLNDLDILELYPHGEGSAATPSLRAYHNRCHRDDDFEQDHTHE